MSLRRSLGLSVLAILLLPSFAQAVAIDGAPLVGEAWAVLALSALALGAVLTGTGIMPSGATGTEMQVITRRAIVPTLVVQQYQATPLLSAGLSNSNMASGGVSSVMVPVQGSQLTSAQATDYSGAFNQPADLNGISEAAFNLKAVVVPIPFLGMEGLVQMNAAIIPKIEAKMNDAGNQLAQYLATQLWTNATNGTINIDGLPLISATTGTYGNIARGTNTWWQGHRMAGAGAVAPTRQLAMTAIVSAAKANGGEMPTMAFCAPGTWVSLANDLTGLEQVRTYRGQDIGRDTESVNVHFNAFSIAGVPFYMDPYATEGEFYFLNHRYLAFYIHEAAAFAFTGFASTLPNNQLGYVGCVVAVLEFICTKPQSVTYQAGYTFANVS